MLAFERGDLRWLRRGCDRGSHGSRAEATSGDVGACKDGGGSRRNYIQTAREKVLKSMQPEHRSTGGESLASS